MDVFVKLLASLSRAGVDFILVGGFAVMYAGFVRTTEDVDILIEAGEANVRRMIDALVAFGSSGAAELEVADFPVEEGSVRVVEDLYYLDIFTQMSGRTYADLLPQTNLISMDGEPVHSLSAEALIELKKDSLRPKDQFDVQALRDIIRQRGG